VIRVGHFRNITHVQGLVAHNLSRQGKGWFEARLGPEVEIQCGRVLVEESDAATTVLVSSAKFLNEKRDLANKFVQANRDLTDWISKNPAEAQKIVKAELLAETRSDMSAELIAHAWKRIIFTSEIPRGSVETFVVNSQKAGFMKTAPDMSRLFEMP